MKPTSSEREKSGASPTSENAKARHLEKHTEDGKGMLLTTNQGGRVNDDQNSLRGGERGPTLLEDFHLREKLTHFDHERIPERIVHARGAGAHGTFQVYENLARYTRACFLQDPKAKTPVFVRFSTVAGSRGSSDLARDARGFAVKFYTDEGIFDLVGNNIPVFFIQDAVKFPDLIHAVKPEPDHGMPQAASAHDTFWDFISLMPESMHMIMWVMSDRAIPRSFRMMEGFAVHTFRFIDAAGASRFVKFHWKPLLGVHSVAWDEAQKISGKDPDFHRRDLWEAIEAGSFPEWELGVQIVEEGQEHSFDFDLFDPTKLIPEELVPVQRIGKLTLDRNPDNFFAETEQVAFHPGNVVAGIDFTNDPLLHGRLFSYTDTQLSRLGGPNFHEIPINRSISPVHNHQRDGHMRQAINRGKVSYAPNTIGGGCPMQARAIAGGYAHFTEPAHGHKTRLRPEKFFDHFSQAALFYNSQSDPEKEHLVDALCFELGKLERPAIRERMVGMLAHVDDGLAGRVAEGLGMAGVPEVAPPLNHSIPANGVPGEHQPKKRREPVGKSAALSMTSTVRSAATRKVAILAADGADAASIQQMQSALAAAGAQSKLVAPRMGHLKTAEGTALKVDGSLLTESSVLYDAVYVPGGKQSVTTLLGLRAAVDFVGEAFGHYKAIAVSGEGIELLRPCPGALLSGSPDTDGDCHNCSVAPGVIIVAGAVTPETTKSFLDAVAEHRYWHREVKQR